jgi:hypothetical protein
VAIDSRNPDVFIKIQGFIMEVKPNQLPILISKHSSAVYFPGKRLCCCHLMVHTSIFYHQKEVSGAVWHSFCT